VLGKPRCHEVYEVLKTRDGDEIMTPPLTLPYPTTHTKIEKRWNIPTATTTNQ